MYCYASNYTSKNNVQISEPDCTLLKHGYAITHYII